MYSPCNLYIFESEAHKFSRGALPTVVT